MPIYAYKCSSCGLSKDILRKISDPVLTLCPDCGKDALEKQVTSAGFQLKGSGWYVTDFREGSQGTTVPPAAADKASEESTSPSKTDAGNQDMHSAAAATPATTAATPTPSAPSTPSPGAAS
jgi:putative FmdB family regulatory protein